MTRRNRRVYRPSDAELKTEMLYQSYRWYRPLNLQGSVGPSRWQWDIMRRKGWPSSYRLMEIYGLRAHGLGWSYFLSAFGLVSPSISQGRRSHIRYRQAQQKRHPDIRFEDGALYPELLGYEVGQQTTDKDIGGGYALRTVKTVVQLR
jgi:hypothetical protein